MPFDVTDLRQRGIPLNRQTREQSDIPLGDFIYLTAEGIAEAQTKLDMSTAEVMRELGEATVDGIPREVTREIQPDGTVTTRTRTESASLLELGFTPTRYQFSETSIEINLDLRVNEEETTESEEEGRYALWGGTYEVTEERKYKESVEANATVSATIEPVPLPVDLSPSEGYTQSSGGAGGEGTDSEGAGGD